ncbi:MAG: hypothetical protein KAI35_07500, partial [Desulfobulbaceae bacterium]|nr:hypothetical protein [Desulfobulbaceae bacterium]
GSSYFPASRRIFTFLKYRNPPYPCHRNHIPPETTQSQPHIPRPVVDRKNIPPVGGHFFLIKDWDQYHLAAIIIKRDIYHANLSKPLMIPIKIQKWHNDCNQQ